MWLKELSHGDFIIVSGGFAGFCGSISYLLKMQEGKVFKWSEFVIHIAASIIFGILAFELCSYFGVNDEYCGAMSGMAGWLGTRVARIFEILIYRKLNIKKEELQ